MGSSTKFGYMCGNGFNTELSAGGDARIYATLKRLKKYETCWEECGIVKVEIDAIRTVKKGMTLKQIVAHQKKREKK